MDYRSGILATAVACLLLPSIVLALASAMPGASRPPAADSQCEPACSTAASAAKPATPALAIKPARARRLLSLTEPTVPDYECRFIAGAIRTDGPR